MFYYRSVYIVLDQRFELQPRISYYKVIFFFFIKTFFLDKYFTQVGDYEFHPQNTILVMLTGTLS